MHQDIPIDESLYLKGLRCPKRLWLELHSPDRLSPRDKAAETRRELGLEAEELARSLYPGGIKIPSASPELSSEAGAEMRRALTMEKIDAGERTLFGACFSHEGVVITVDVLQLGENRGVRITKLKGTTRVRRSHREILALQSHVLSALGYRIDRAEIVSLNRRYVREGELDLETLYLRTDLSLEIRKMEKDVQAKLDGIKPLLQGPLPERAIGSHCTGPLPCEGKQECWKHIPRPSVFDISALSMELKMKFFGQGIIEFSQIRDFSDLSEAQKLQIEGELSGKSHTNPEVLQAFLEPLTFPLSFLDFEAFQQAVPAWDGVRPFSHIPFQYSLHIESEGGEVEHREFLAPPGRDPRQELITRLTDDIPEEGSILVYNKTFEKGVLKALSAFSPSSAPLLRGISARIVDLMLPFKEKACYRPSMEGKYSIKNILPALVPEMADAYERLDLVHNGLEAMGAYSRLSDGVIPDELRRALLGYCRLDTLAMVEILRVLRRLV